MTIEIAKGDLLKEQTEAIINTVNCVGVMGKGIALQFKQRWPDNYAAYEDACKRKAVQTGKMFVYELGALAPKPHYIINFPTKNHWKERSKYEYIDEGLQDLVKVIRELGISSIAVPPLGCGNGGLDWNIVRKKIEDAFYPLGNKVTVHLYEPTGAPRAQNMVAKTQKPNMTLPRAVLLKLLSIYKELDYSLSSIEVQKLAYFGFITGDIPKLRYAKGKYGPFADNLRHTLNDLNGHYIKGVGDHDKIKSEISLAENAVSEADAELEGSADVLDNIRKISELIDGFETPYGMELLATVHWVATHDPFAKDVRSAIDAIYNWEQSKPDWTERKKAVMNEHHIGIAWRRLADHGWIK